MRSSVQQSSLIWSALFALSSIWTGCDASLPPAEAPKDLSATTPDDSAYVQDSADLYDDALELVFDLVRETVATDNSDASVTDETSTPTNDCPALGVQNSWQGIMEGYLLYTKPGSEDEEPESGIFLVTSDLGLTMTCIEQKWIMAGSMYGESKIAGSNYSHPFTASIVGDFDPFNRSTDAQIVDGEVLVFGVVPTSFTGTLNGQISDDEIFEGDWFIDVMASDDSPVKVDEGWGSWSATYAP